MARQHDSALPRTEAAATPPSRRERKKSLRRATFIALARQAFVEDGYDATSMDSIAAAADVAIGTLYNYFPTKADLLVAVLEQDIQPILTQNAGAPGGGGIDALLLLISECFAWFDRYDRSLLRRFAADALAMQPRRGEGYFLFDKLLAARTLAIVTELHQRGDIAARVDPALCAAVVFNLGNAAFYDYLVDPEVDGQAIVERLRGQLALLWTGIGTDARERGGLG